jgi:hypothetical protein
MSTPNDGSDRSGMEPELGGDLSQRAEPVQESAAPQEIVVSNPPVAENSGWSYVGPPGLLTQEMIDWLNGEGG